MLTNILPIALGFFAKLLLSSLLIIMLSACSPLGMVTGLFKSDVPSVDLQVGKTNEKITGIKASEIVVGNKENKTAENIIEDSKIGTITATGNVIVDEKVPMWVWALMILGWLLPSPSEIYTGLGKLFINIKRYIKEWLIEKL